ncbi:hypothetical protein [Cellulomonas massiliensis]|uniref:hypothetical protein n=1 Tax=Cellulomonas massiliensis TaxID=1465811 RepID=UPI0003199704|nr:hypothetical protein [Cellulomonas massiliensis]
MGRHASGPAQPARPPRDRAASAASVWLQRVALGAVAGAAIWLVLRWAGVGDRTALVGAAGAAVVVVVSAAVAATLPSPHRDDEDDEDD